MKRRSFLKVLGLTPAIAVLPKVVEQIQETPKVEPLPPAIEPIRQEYRFAACPIDSAWAMNSASVCITRADLVTGSSMTFGQYEGYSRPAMPGVISVSDD